MAQRIDTTTLQNMTIGGAPSHTKEEFDAATHAAQSQITEALKILSAEPAIMCYFGLLELKPVDDPEVQVRLCTRNGSSVAGLDYNPFFINRLDDPSELAMIFYGEALRLALHHPTTRFMQPAGVNLLSSNLICFEDQHVLSKWRDNVKAVVPTIPTYAQVKPILDKTGFKKSEEWTLEKIFAHLLKEWRNQQNSMKQSVEQKIQQQMQQQRQQAQNGQGQSGQQQQSQNGEGQSGQGQSGDGQDQQSQNGQGQSGDGQDQQSQNGQGQQSQNGQGQGQGNGLGQGDMSSAVHDLMQQLDNMQRNSPDLRGAKEKRTSDAGNAMDDYFDSSERHAQKMMEKWGENDLVDEKIQQITNHIASDASRWGNVSGMLKQMILEANAPKFDPTTVVKHFKQEIQSEQMESTRSKTNRRFGYVLPGWRHKMKSSILFAIDCSGSMSDDDVALGEAFVNKFIKHAKVSYCFWDGVCGEITDLKRKEKNFELVGRGCTNPDSVLERLEEEHLDFGGLVFFTDNGFNWERPKNKWAHKIFIISTESADEPPDWVRYHLSMKDIKDYEK